MDRHLNVFLPYERPPHHEDQLTRAAMIVMRAIPLARDALLARIGAPPSARLPEPELDIQARDVLKPSAVSEAEGPSLRQLVSVFLSPDEELDLSAAQIAERAGEQRLDGVLRFGDELVVVIESKITDKAASDQARLLRMRGVTPEQSRVNWLGWHELLEDWWSLLERGLLAPAERVLVEDLIAVTEEHFPRLLPFTTLGRAGETDLRRRRRLVALLREATGLDDVEAERRPQPGAAVMLDTAVGTKSVQRISLQQDGGALALAAWPGELKPQATALYRAGSAQGLLDLLAAHPGEWQARPNVHLAFRNSYPAQRLYLHCRLDLSEYARRWSGHDFGRVGAHHFDRIRDDLWPWLRSREYAGLDDDELLDAFLGRLGSRDAYLRPGIAVQRLWPWAQAVDLDDRGALAAEVRAAITELLTALREPLPPACTR